jgi:hypothetical protein
VRKSNRAADVQFDRGYWDGLQPSCSTRFGLNKQHDKFRTTGSIVAYFGSYGCRGINRTPGPGADRYSGKRGGCNDSIYYCWTDSSKAKAVRERGECEMTNLFALAARGVDLMRSPLTECARNAADNLTT